MLHAIHRGILALLVACLSCAQADEVVPRSDIRLSKEVTKGMIDAILAVRGRKDAMERWDVDILQGDVRIIKSRKDGTILPPGGAVEFWYRDKDGKWKARPTA